MSTIPTHQKALFLQAKHGEFALGTAEVGKAGPGKIHVRVESVALNPVDWLVQETGFFVNEYPTILGIDAAGVVVQLGEGVTSFSIDDRMWIECHFNKRLPTFKQHGAAAAKIPSNITFDQAASIPLCLVTATIGLYNKKWERGGAELYPPWKEGGRGKYADQPIVIWGGSTSVGQYAIRLAKLSGFAPIITMVSPRNSELVRSLGATHTIDRSLPPAKITERVSAITSKPISIIYDAISRPETQNILYDILTPGGKLVIVLPVISVKESKLNPDKELVQVFGTVHNEENKECGTGLFGNLTELLEAGDVKPNVVEVVSGALGGITSGLERLKSNQVSGKKLVVRPQDTV